MWNMLENVKYEVDEGELRKAIKKRNKRQKRRRRAGKIGISNQNGNPNSLTNLLNFLDS